MQPFFENKNGSIYTKKDCEIILHEKNVEVLPNGNLKAIMFGSLIIVHDPQKKDMKTYTITLSTRVELSIYSQDQWYIDDNKHYIISFLEGDKVIENERVPANIQNVYDMFQSLLQGNVSNMITPAEYYEIVNNAVENNESFGYSKVLLELLLSRLFRSDGEPLGIKKAILETNTFNGVTFEDWSKATYLNKKRSFESQEKNPSVLEGYMRK